MKDKCKSDDKFKYIYGSTNSLIRTMSARVEQRGSKWVNREQMNGVYGNDSEISEGNGERWGRKEYRGI